MRVVAVAPPDFPLLERVRAEAELVAGEDPAQLRPHVRKADVILLAPRNAGRLLDLFPEAREVQWIHTLSAGVETLPFDLLRSSAATVTNSRGLYADALAEFAIAAMLFFARDLRRLLSNQDQRRWEPYTVERLESRSVGVIGFGGIGQAVGKRAAALGMRVMSVRRQQEFGEPTVEDVLRECEYVVLSVPLTPSTRGMISAPRIALMQRHAVLINVSRGAVIDERALTAALQQERIRGAALDVFETEPLPPTHPLWSLPNVLISPHSADRTADSHERAMLFFLENLGRFRRGESLENVVDKQAGY